LGRDGWLQGVKKGHSCPTDKPHTVSWGKGVDLTLGQKRGKLHTKGNPTKKKLLATKGQLAGGEGGRVVPWKG